MRKLVVAAVTAALCAGCSSGSGGPTATTQEAPLLAKLGPMCRESPRTVLQVVGDLAADTGVRRVTMLRQVERLVVLSGLPVQSCVQAARTVSSFDLSHPTG